MAQTTKKSTQKELPITITKFVSDPEYYLTGTDFYTKVDTHFVTDNRLTHNALVILFYISSQSDTWVWNDKDIIRKMKFSKTPFYTAKKLLVETGYVKMEKTYGHRYSKVTYYTDLTAYRIKEVVKQSKFTESINREVVKQSKFTESTLTESLNTESLNTESLNEDTNIYNLNTEKLNTDNSNTDKHGDTSMMILDLKSSAEASILNSEKIPTEFIPQPDNVIFEKADESNNIDSAIENKNENLTNNESEKDMIINNEYINEDEFNFVDTTANLNVNVNENLKLDSDIVSTANEYSAQENETIDTDSAHSEIDVITPNIEMTEQQKLNFNLADMGMAMFANDDLWNKPAIDTDFVEYKKIDTDELKNNADKLINKTFDDITAFDPTFEGDIK